MSLWRAKRGPVFTRGRAVHAIVGWGTVLGFGLVGHLVYNDLYGATSFGWAVVVAVGIGWELATPIISKFTNWKHPFGDAIDMLAYTAGATVGALPIWLMTP